MRIAAAVIGLWIVLAVAPAVALKIDISREDVERALVIARSRDSERAAFHTRYIQVPSQEPYIERAELITELRRVVLLAEQKVNTTDRAFAYSATRAAEALSVWRRRVALVLRVRFHPQNNYVDAPPVTVRLVGNDGALVGVTRDAIRALPPGRQGEFVPVLGATVEAVFEAEAMGQAVREFVVTLDGRELGRVAFDMSAID